MIRYIIIFLIALSSFTANAQNDNGKANRHFNPQRFENQLEQYVLGKIELSPSESAAFLPIFRDMRSEVVKVMQAGRKVKRGRPSNEKEWEEALRTFDSNEVKLKKIQQTYHIKMLKVIPASKVMLMVRAEDEFHRESFRKMQMRMAARKNRK